VKDDTLFFYFAKVVKDDTGRTIPKFGEWDVNNPASADGFTVIFSKARDEKKAPTKPGHITNRSASADSKDSRTDKMTSYNSRTNASVRIDSAIPVTINSCAS
jgi:hypothetical protein